jgi:hypothetical protein
LTSVARFVLDIDPEFGVVLRVAQTVSEAAVRAKVAQRSTSPT